MQKKKATQQPQKPVETLPSVEDFFTQFLDKKKRNYTKKLEKIDQLQKKNLDELTTEQKELVNNRKKVVDDAAYYDEIKQLYFQASSKKEGGKQTTGGSTGNNNATLGLYYLAKSVKEQGENALRVVSGQGVEFQEKVHNYHRRIFQQDGVSADTLKNAVTALDAYTQDSEFVNQINEIWSEGKLSQKQETVAPVQTEVRKESTNKPQLFAMSSDDEEEEQDQKPTQQATQNNKDNDSEFKPTFVPLPEDDAEENFAFEGGNRGRGERRGKKPRGDKPYRKYEGERRGDRKEGEEGREERPYRKYDGERRGDRKEGEEGREDRPARNYDKYQKEGEQGEREYRGNREYKGDGDRPYRGNRGNRGDRDNREYRSYRDTKDNGEEGNREERPRQRGIPSRGRDYDKTHEDNRESGERRKPYGRGRGGNNYNKAQRDDNTYQKKEGQIDNRGD